jgi:hypothetical protein
MEDLLGEALGRIFFLAVLGMAAWVLLPRTFYFDNNIMVYSLETSFCNDYNVCNVERFFAPLKLRVDVLKSEVVWLDTDSGQLGSWDQCTIADKENWTCANSTMKMVDGQLQSVTPNVQHPPGYVYRLYWLASFLPDIRRQGG